LSRPSNFEDSSEDDLANRNDTIEPQRRRLTKKHMIKPKRLAAVQVEPSLFTVEQVAAKLSLSSRSIYRLSDLGHMPRPIKIGGSVRWRRDEIEDWIESDCSKDFKN